MSPPRPGSAAATSPAAPPSTLGDRAFWTAWVSTLGVFFLGELLPYSVTGEPLPSPWRWLAEARLESLIWLLWLLLGALAWWIRLPRGARGWSVSSQSTVPAADRSLLPADGRDWMISLGLGFLGVAIAWWFGRNFEGLPPALHDEYSHLFLARTFLAGRTSFDRPPLHELFDQMHVLNEGRMASRYFPAVGLWLAPFVALERPAWGWWIAQGLFTMLGYWIGRELAGRRGGLLAGLLIAVCPGLVLFSQLLLSHHPTLLGLGVFLLGRLRMRRLGSAGWGVAAGCGLAFAALARPMTALGVALPWGIDFVWQTIRDPSEVRLWPAMGVPLLAGAVGMLWYDAAVTGSPWQTPYGLYTELYTPRHVYGFDNVVRGERSLSPRVIGPYDAWAENLTPALAARNAAQRLLASGQWTLGLLPLTFALGLGCCLWQRLAVGTRLCLASIVGLHLAHVPYWYAGILHFHYVFESLPLWLLFLSAAGLQACGEWRAVGRNWLQVWGGLALLTGIGMNFTGEQGLWTAPYRDGASQFHFARQQHADFLTRLERAALRRPALVLVDPDPSDRHIDHVVNNPPLAGEVLLGRWLPQRYSVVEIGRAWPGRTVYVFDVRTGRVSELGESRR